MLDVLASVIGLGKREFEALSCAILLGYGLTENKQIVRTMYRLGRKAIAQGYQTNDRGLVECKVGVIRPQPFLI